MYDLLMVIVMSEIAFGRNWEVVGRDEWEKKVSTFVAKVAIDVSGVLS